VPKNFASNLRKPRAPGQCGNGIYLESVPHTCPAPERLRAIKVPKHWCDFHCRKRVGYGGEALSLKLLLPHDISPQH